MDRKWKWKPIYVPCGSCNACCKNVIVSLYDYDLESGFPYKKRNRKPEAEGDAKYCLLSQRNWDCIYFRDERCTIYENRPSICRAFDCRNTLWPITPRAEGEEYTAELEVEYLDS